MAESMGARELRRMAELYQPRAGDRAAATAEMWDRRAEHWRQSRWTEDLHGGPAMHRVQATADYLRGQGLLGPDCDVIDIGCGPGRFAAEFARTARSVTGVDISPRTVEYAQLFTRQAGRDNTRFFTGDFKTLDLAQAGLEGAFDLAFCSITPAVQGEHGLEKLMRLSRRWCYMSLFVHGHNALHQRMLQEVFPTYPRKIRDGRAFYAAFNLLFLQGYYPITSYYRQPRSSRLPVTLDSAGLCLAQLLPPEERSQENLEALYRWMGEHAEEDGAITEYSEFTYGSLLWDKTDRGLVRQLDGL